MKNINIFSFFVFIHIPSLVFSIDDQKVFIVKLAQRYGEDKALHEIEDYHHSYLLSVKSTEEEARASLIYSYKRSINGFAAVLTPEEADVLSEKEEVVSIYRSNPEKYSLQTTRSWDFVGLKDQESKPMNWFGHYKFGEDLLEKANHGKGVIVGVLDSGVWPESKSFSDKGMGPIPKSWKGICQSGQDFNSSHCNRKIIGARYYLKGYENHYGPLNTTLDSKSPRDLDGHGTHTASTVGGAEVPNASVFGFATGTARGGAPRVHLAIYKACWAVPGQNKANGNSCFEEDMLGAIDDAIADGVDVLSMSIGSSKPIPYDQDGIAVGAFHAAKHNIVVVCAAGNAGPAPSSLSNPAPWIITVGASTLDRKFLAPVVLGNGMLIEGETVTPYKMENSMLPLVYAADVVVPQVAKTVASQCLPDSLSLEKVKGKIVLCFRGNGTRVGKGMEVKRVGGAGFILGNSPANGMELAVDPHVLPATIVSSDDALRILEYIKSDKKPMAKIVPAKTVTNIKPAPVMASFTSRGPNVIDPHILKPDVTAPGLNILAAWSGSDSPTKLENDPRIVEYSIESGTSMACPHVAAAAALVKAIHPKWSSAAIRSALTTTAGLTNNLGLPITDANGKPDTPFGIGAGHFMPQRAADPGLVYDASYSDYNLYLCSLGFKNPDPQVPCQKETIPSYNLNYPSLQISKLNGTVTVKRTVTNVGRRRSIYFSSVRPPLGISVKVQPSILFFDHIDQKKTFTITIRARSEMVKQLMGNGYGFGWYTWNDGIHNVRSPMAISLA